MVLALLAATLIVYLQRGSQTLDRLTIRLGQNELAAEDRSGELKAELSKVRGEVRKLRKEVRKLRRKKRTKKASGNSEERHQWEGIKDLGGGRYSVAQSEIDWALANLDTMAREARVIPHVEDGRESGFRVFAIRRGSALAKMGFKNGDVLMAVNGHDLMEREHAVEIYGGLQQEKTFELRVLRAGSPITLRYQVE